MAPEIKPPSETLLFDRTHTKSKMPVYNEIDTCSDDRDTSHFLCNSNVHVSVHTSRMCRILLPQTVPDMENSQGEPKRGISNLGV